MRFLTLPLILLAGCHAAPTQPAADRPIRGMKDLLHMDRCGLETLYRGCEVGSPPCGVLDGRAIINAGSGITVPASHVVHALWKGKVIEGDTMVNRLPFGIRAVEANVYLGESWLDGKPALILDYAGKSKLFPKVRDEVREVSPGLYLGATHERTADGPKFLTFFTLAPRK